MTVTRAERRTLLLGAAGMFLLALFVFWPSLAGGFIWDDELFVKNELIHSTDGLSRIWATTQAYDYWPVSYTSFWIEWRLWGMNPIGYHVTNLVLHVANAWMIWVLLRRLRVPGAFLGTLIFLVHPVNVESVAWIAQRKSNLSMFFLLVAMLMYEPPQGARRGLWYIGSLLAFTMGMLSKGSIAMAPFMFLLFAWWQRGRITRTDVTRAAPFLGIAMVLTIVNIWFQTHGGEAIRHVTLLERLLGAGAIVWFYLYKALWPIGRSFIYPLWHVDPADVRWWIPTVAAALVTAGLFWQRRRPWGRALLFAWCFFGLALVPVMGFADVYFMKFSLVADHYQYLAIVAVCAAVAAGLARIVARPRPA